MKISVSQIKKLREETGAPIMRVKKIIEEVKDEKKALEILKKEGFEKALERKDRKVSQGLVVVYEHHSGKVASIVELLCETDFVARNKLFKDLAHDLALQVASMNPQSKEELENQDFIKDSSKKVSDLIKEVIAKTGENICLGRFCRIEVGK